MYIAIAIIAFGLLIAIHEIGHFSAAKLLGVKVNEFAIGMGPAILKKQGKETKYSLRILPFGGFCAMEGEDEDSEDPRAFSNKSWWRKVIILAAGSFLNFVAGFIIVLVLFSFNTAFPSSTISGFHEDYQYQGADYLLPGDRIISINGESIRTYDDVSMFLSRSNGKTVNLVIDRNDQRIRFDSFPMERNIQTSSGMVYGLSFGIEKSNVGTVLKYSWYNSVNFVRLVRIGLTDLFGGKAGINDLSGPVGIVALINDTASASETRTDAVRQIAFLIAFIAVNLAVMNMLPIPALDGGRILFMFITMAIEKITRRKLNRKYEAYIHGVCLVLLFGLMIYVLYNDIAKLL